MKTDRELLELAAKAAGFTLDWDVPAHASPWRMTGTPGEDDYGPAAMWNPLADDGDALRLAVTMSFMTLTYHDEDWERCQHDGYAATRRAIVRAAAAIGEGTRPFPTADEIRENWT